MSGAALTFKDICFAYDGTKVLDSLSFDVPTGGVTALMGPSGCGKSTLVLLAAGLLQPSSGAIGRGFHRSAVLFQDPLLLPWRTALANVGFALKADDIRREERDGRAREMLLQVGLRAEDHGKYPRQLSGGMRQRVALARALVIKPDLLLLDEPFTGLDLALARQMLALVRKSVDELGMTALVVTHDPYQAARFADTINILSASPARLLASHDLRKLTDRTAAMSAILTDLDAASETLSF